MCFNTHEHRAFVYYNHIQSIRIVNDEYYTSSIYNCGVRVNETSSSSERETEYEAFACIFLFGVIKINILLTFVSTNVSHSLLSFFYSYTCTCMYVHLLSVCLFIVVALLIYWKTNTKVKTLINEHGCHVIEQGVVDPKIEIFFVLFFCPSFCFYFKWIPCYVQLIWSKFVKLRISV